MKRIIVLIILIFMMTGCSGPSELLIKKNKNYLELTVNESYKIANIIDKKAINWVSSNPEVVIIDGEYVIGISAGQSIVSANIDGQTINYIINVNANVSSISIEGKTRLNIGEVAKYTAIVHPEDAFQEVNWESSDEEIIAIDEEGNATGVAFGMARIIATSKADKRVVAEKNILIENNRATIDFENFIYQTEDVLEEIDINDYQYLEPLFRNAIGSVIGVSGVNNGSIGEYGSGIIYKREVILDNGTAIYDDIFSHLYEIDYFRYYVVCNEEILRNSNSAKVYYGEKHIKSNIIAMDEKSNLAVLTFESRLYFPVAKFSDSEIIKGENVFAVGHPEGYNYYQSISAGVVSNVERYISYDTDGDDVYDWGMMFIQHDAATSKGNYGGPLFNLKGEVIAVNTRKVIAHTIENMNFAVPIDEVEKIIAILETGEKPQRVVLGVRGYEVSSMIANPNNPAYVGLNLYGVTYGFYVVEVSDGLAKGIVQANDIILAYNSVEIRHLSDLRNELHRFLLGSGEIVKLLVMRNGEIIELSVIY